MQREHFTDEPKLLGNPQARTTRQAELRDPHIAPLTAFVDKLRVEMGSDYQIPYFDPWDGGIAAEVLYLLEAPGAKAVLSGFISRNNPDESAKNFFQLNKEAGIPRNRTVTWNIVPWYIGSGSRIRPANSRDIEVGLGLLDSLFNLLPRLRATVLIGRKAQRTSIHIEKMLPNVRVFMCPHPSPLFVNHSPSNREKILVVLQQVQAYLNHPIRSQAAMPPRVTSLAN